jgi:hypothetical protein
MADGPSTDAQVELTQLKPGDGVRWAVGSPGGPRSSTWRFWGNKKGDFYLSVRALGGTFKTSLHRDRRCQTGFTKEYSTINPLGRERHLDRWALPDAPIVKAFQVIVPANELTEFPAEDKDPMKWLSSAPVGWLSIVTVYLASFEYLKQAGEPFPGASLGADLIGLAVARTRVAFVIHMHQPELENMISDIDRYRKHMMVRPDIATRPRGPGWRAVLGGGDGTETRYMIEISVGPDASHAA